MGGIRGRVVDLHRFYPDLAFFLITDPDPYSDPDPVPNPGFWWPKNVKRFTAGFFFFFWSKIAIYLSLVLHKERTSYRRSLQHSKVNIQHWSQIRIQQLKLMRIRIHNPNPGVDYLFENHIYFLQADKINPITKAGGQKLVVLDDR